MKKLTKKFITILMSLLICIGIGASAVFADEKGTDVSTTIAESYIWYVTPSLTNAVGSIEVGVTDNTIAYGNKLQISYEGNNDDGGKHYLVDEANADNKLQYSITGFVSDNDGVALIAPAGELKDNTLTVALEDTAVYSGTYSDHLTFTLEILTPKAAPTIKTGNFLTFSSDGEFTLGFKDCYAQGLQVSTDTETWTAFNGSSDPVTAIKDGTKYCVYLRGDNMTAINGSNLSITPTVDTTKVDCSGNIMTLLDYDNADNVVMDEHAFVYLFADCTALASAPELPATTLAYGCYHYMFYGCTGLTQAPELPATTLADECYQNMFQGCTSLEVAPELPATTLAYNCYEQMFSGCTSLEVAPELPATTLSEHCYTFMFEDCTSLIKRATTPATVTVEDTMYYGCTKLS